MLEVLLVFSVNGELSDISDRIFYSLDECVEFVNTIAREDVVNSDYGFIFTTSDGQLFDGQCIAMEDWAKK